MTPDHAPAGDSHSDARARIITAALRLVGEGGREAVTTRAVEAAAGVQAPTIYRLFGDKRGLLDEVTEHVLAEFVATKAPPTEDADPIQALRDGWRLNVEFGLENPGLYALMNGEPRPGVTWSAAEAGLDMLRARVRHIAAAGRLRVTEERAVNLIVASARGAVLTLIGMPDEHRDLGMLDDVLKSLVSSITTDPPPEKPFQTAAAANALRVSLRRGQTTLTAGESALLDELLVRLAS